MKDFLKKFFDRLRKQHPKELKAFFFSLILALLWTLLFQIYLNYQRRLFLTKTRNSVTFSKASQELR